MGNARLECGKAYTSLPRSPARGHLRIDEHFVVENSRDQFRNESKHTRGQRLDRSGAFREDLLEIIVRVSEHLLRENEGRVRIDWQRQWIGEIHVFQPPFHCLDRRMLSCAFTGVDHVRSSPIFGRVQRASLAAAGQSSLLPTRTDRRAVSFARTRRPIGSVPSTEDTSSAFPRERAPEGEVFLSTMRRRRLVLNPPWRTVRSPRRPT